MLNNICYNNCKIKVIDSSTQFTNIEHPSPKQNQMIHLIKTKIIFTIVKKSLKNNVLY